MKFKEILGIVNNCKEYAEGVTERCKWSVMTHKLLRVDKDMVSLAW